MKRVRVRKGTWKEFNPGTRIAFRHGPDRGPVRLGTVVKRNWGGQVYSTMDIRWDPYPEGSGKEWMNTDRYLNHRMLTVLWHIQQGFLRIVIAEEEVKDADSGLQR